MTARSATTWVGEVEVGESLVPTGVLRELQPGDEGARLLVRLHQQVLGFVSLPMTGAGITAEAVGAAVLAQLALPLSKHLEADGLPLPGHLPVDGLGGSGWCSAFTPVGDGQRITVVLCTRDRPAVVAGCIADLRRLHYPNFEVVVVDNCPASEETKECFAGLVGDDPRFRYVREPAPGLSRARNRGLREARSRYVAFTDDDVRVDPWWLDAIAAGFARDPRAGCVTGLVPAAALDNPSQQYFDARYTWGTGMEAHVYDLHSDRMRSPIYPYSAGIFGTGANFAVDRTLFLRLGGFDDALGAGSPAAGGEDLDAFVRVLLAGRSLVYEPSAVVWHAHRADARALRRQLYAYGLGLSAFLTKYLVNTRTTGDIVARLPAGARRMCRLLSRTQTDDRTAAGHADTRTAPAGLTLTELVGMAAGPLAYARSRRHSRLTRVGARAVVC